GDVAIDLGRPVHPIAAWLAEDIGRAGQACLIRFIGPLLVGGLLYGLLVPVHFLPGWAQAFAYATPFPSMLQVPLDMATERYGDAESVALLAMQVGWAAVLLAVAVRVFDRGTRKLVLQGG